MKKSLKKCKKCFCEVSLKIYNEIDNQLNSAVLKFIIFKNKLFKKCNVLIILDNNNIKI